MPKYDYVINEDNCPYEFFKGTKGFDARIQFSTWFGEKYKNLVREWRWLIVQHKGSCRKSECFNIYCFKCTEPYKICQSGADAAGFGCS